MTTQTSGHGRDVQTGIQTGIQRGIEPQPDRVPRRDGHRYLGESERCASRAVDIEMTSVIDGLTHAITADDFDAGIWMGQGRYRAACGAPVLVACMSSTPGPRCRRCPPMPSRQLRRSSVLARLIAALSS